MSNITGYQSRLTVRPKYFMWSIKISMIIEFVELETTQLSVTAPHSVSLNWDLLLAAIA